MGVINVHLVNFRGRASAIECFSRREQVSFDFLFFARYFSTMSFIFYNLAAAGSKRVHIMPHALVKLSNWKWIAERMKKKQVERCKRWAEYWTNQQQQPAMWGCRVMCKMAMQFLIIGIERVANRNENAVQRKKLSNRLMQLILTPGNERKKEMNENDGKALISQENGFRVTPS